MEIILNITGNILNTTSNIKNYQESHINIINHIQAVSIFPFYDIYSQLPT